jgi:tRNA pseudouridine55 synthase
VTFDAGNRTSAGSPPDSTSQALAGLALLRKPEGITSFKALSPIKRAIGSGRVGHAGTLDRFARGLLVILAGAYSRLSPYVMSGEKLYRGLIAFGSETDTLDPEGRVVAVAPPPSAEGLRNALTGFRGQILQRPPAYSAVHINGRRAYQIALEGGIPDLKERRVEIHSLELLSYEDCEALVEVRCSSGTYIRSLARDIAAACGSKAHLRALERLAIGPFLVEDAVDPETFAPRSDLRELRWEEAAGLGLRAIGIGDTSLESRFRNGGRIDPGAFSVLDGGPSVRKEDGCVSDAAVFGRDGALLGIAQLDAEGPNYKVVLPARSAPCGYGTATWKS